jgi:histidinol-phosphatase (PHP family)
MAEHVARALEIGVNAICFTDHADFNPHDNGYGYYDKLRYFVDLEAARVEANGVELLAGVEFGEPHAHSGEFSELCQLPYDFVMGSVHFTDRWPDSFFNGLVRDGVTAAECYDAYWDTVLQCVRFGGFDCLGHIDIPKRYYQTLLYDEVKLRTIFREMVDRSIILEVNTSSLFKGCDEPMPGRELLELYRLEGGKHATVGSDAHSAEQLGAHPMARELLRECGLTEVGFRARKMFEIRNDLT